MIEQVDGKTGTKSSDQRIVRQKDDHDQFRWKREIAANRFTGGLEHGCTVLC
jgi:hypothetical protein